MRSELETIAQAGYGGVEIQAFALGLLPGDSGGRIGTVGQSQFFASLATAVAEARALDLDVDINFGSGWPMGGPFVTEEIATQLTTSTMDLTGPSYFQGALPAAVEPGWVVQSNALAPVIGPFDTAVTLDAVVAGRIDTTADPPRLDMLTDISDRVSDQTLQWRVPRGTWRVFAIYRNGTSHFVLGGAYTGTPESALVVDHLSAAGAETFIAGFGDPMLAALGANSVDGIFIDSFELIGDLPWTGDFAHAFINEMGYDATPFLPLLFRHNGESKYVQIITPFPPRPVYASAVGERVREDYETVRARLFRERFLARLAQWTGANGLTLRIQAHGGWGNAIDDYGVADIPESEGLYAGGSYDFLKLASSAAHVAGRTVVSSESFVTFVPTPDAISEEDLYLLSSRALSAGINRLVHHGHPYPLMQATGPWYPFDLPGLPFSASTRFSPDRPIWSALEALNRYRTRLAFIMRLGDHRADVAWLLAGREIPDQLTVNPGGISPEAGESPLSLAMKRGGYVYDRVSRSALSRASVERGRLRIGKANYSALLIDRVEAASVELMDRIEAAARAGIAILVAGGLPQRARGFRDAETRDALVQQAGQRLSGLVRTIDGPETLVPALAAAGILPVLRAADGELPVAIDRRHAAGIDIALLCNERGVPDPFEVDLLSNPVVAVLLDPITGQARHLDIRGSAWPPRVELQVAERRCAILILAGRR